MQKKLFFTFAIFTVVLINACKKDNSPMSMIEGKWQGGKWLIGETPQNGFDVSIIGFEFKKNNYKTHFGSMSGEGTFNLDNNCFNAVSIYGSKKKCPILKMTKDTMVWMMDSVNQPGNLYLIRVKE